MSPKDGHSPTAVFTLLLFGKQVAYSLAAVARIGVADHMSTHFASIDELAEKVGAQPAALFRVMRLLASVACLTKRQDSASRLLL
jgi:hypothetical protein